MEPNKEQAVKLKDGTTCTIMLDHKLTTLWLTRLEQGCNLELADLYPYSKINLKKKRKTLYSIRFR